MAYRIVNRKELYDKALTHDVRVITPEHFVVKSGASGEVYVVRITNERAVCTCPRQQYISRGMNDNTNGCSHTQAALLARESIGQYRLTTRHPTASLARLKRRVVDVLGGDGVVFTARKGNPLAPSVTVDEEITGFTVDELNAQLFG